MVGHACRERALSITPRCIRLFLLLFSTTSMVTLSWRLIHSPFYLPYLLPYLPPSTPPSLPPSPSSLLTCVICRDS